MQIARYKIGASVITNYTVRGWECGRMHGNVARRYGPTSELAIGLMPPLLPPHDDRNLRLMFVPNKLSRTWNADCRLGKQLRGENGDRAFTACVI